MKLPFFQQGDKPKTAGDGSGPSTSSSSSQQSNSRNTVSFHGTAIPVDYLVQRHDPKKYPARAISTPEQIKQTRKDVAWAASREQTFAAAAASIHLIGFAYNLAFWGFEGMPQDRYWPDSTRLKLGIKSGRYGNLDGTKRVWYDNLSAMEGMQ